MKILTITLISVLFIASFSPKAISEEIQIVYLERPPYYYSENDEVKGFLADLTEQIFDSAKVSYSWLSLPPQRIIKTFESTDAKICSPGWFMKQERMEYANFTLPIYQNKAQVILILKNNKDLFDGIDSLSSLFKTPTLTMGTVATYRYSHYIDDLIEKYNPPQIKVNSSATQLVKMISTGRISYMITSPVETDYLIEQAGFYKDQFDLLTFADSPTGNKRYLMCTKAVDISTLKKLNSAIEKIVDPVIWSE